MLPGVAHAARPRIYAFARAAHIGAWRMWVAGLRGRLSGDLCRGHLAADRRGVIALEFALILPLLILFCFGTVEVGRFVLLQMKLDQLAASVADLGTRDRTLSAATIDDIFAAGAHIVRPFDLAADGRITLSAVGLTAGDQPRVLWQRRSGGTLDLPSETGTVGSPATLPDEITLAVGQTVVVAEVSFSYRGMFGLLPERITTKRAYFRPRLGSLQELSSIGGSDHPLIADAGWCESLQASVVASG
ncbi:MAG: pilus assembly protein [Geminicoccaceae bacterium]|nr:pilus assembly protein [Geminicoccaceae bacterium]HRY22791.1 pilus assembly protein [Geminicoccaceae bacterium]